MRLETRAGGKPAKLTTMEMAVATLMNGASKEVLSRQQIEQALAQAVLTWLPTLDEPALTDFFAGIEAVAPAAVARKVERHPLRPAAVAPIVAARRAEDETRKEAERADAARAKEARERELLAKLIAKHGAAATEKAPKAPAA